MFLTHSPRATKEAGVPLEEMLALTTDWLKKCDVCCALESLHAWIILKCSHIHAQKGLSSSIRFLDVTWIESCLTELLSRPNRKKHTWGNVMLWLEGLCRRSISTWKRLKPCCWPRAAWDGGEQLVDGGGSLHNGFPKRQTVIVCVWVLMISLS